MSKGSDRRAHLVAGQPDGLPVREVLLAVHLRAGQIGLVLGVHDRDDGRACARNERTQRTHALGRVHDVAAVRDEVEAVGLVQAVAHGHAHVFELAGGQRTGQQGGARTKGAAKKGNSKKGNGRG